MADVDGSEVHLGMAEGRASLMSATLREHVPQLRSAEALWASAYVALPLAESTPQAFCVSDSSR